MNSGTISNCYNTGEAEASVEVGGICGDNFCLARRFTPLSYEAADGILQNVLRACGYEEAHMKTCCSAL